MSDRHVLMYSFNLGLTALELARPVRDMAAGWNQLCAGDGEALECVVTRVREHEIVNMQLPGPYRKLAHGASDPVLIDEQSRVYFSVAQKANTWTSVAMLDGAFDLATHATLGEACGLFPDGRITCVERL